MSPKVEGNPASRSLGATGKHCASRAPEFTPDPLCGPDSRGHPRGARRPCADPPAPRAAPPAVRARPGLVLTAWLVPTAAAGPSLGGGEGAPRGPHSRPDLSPPSPSATAEQRLIPSSTESTFFLQIHGLYGFICKSVGAALSRVLTFRHPCS